MRLNILISVCLVLLSNQYSFSQEVSSVEAFQRLEDGNKRFVSQKLNNSNRDIKTVKELSHGQHPYAIILCCADSRTSPEVIFDEGLGKLFVVRVAGNIVDPYLLGSIEYAAENLGSHLLLVLGHSECGAVHAAVEAKDYGININSIVTKITPAVNKAKKEGGDVMEHAVEENVLMTVEEIKSSEGLKKLLDDHKLEIRAGVYHLETGKVEFFKD